MFPKLSAESIGTFWLVLGGCGSAVLAAAFPDVGIGLLGVSLAFGLTVRDRRLRARPDLGRPLQPRGFRRLVGRRPLSRRPALALLVAQVLGGIVGAGVLYSSPAAKRISALPADSRPMATARIHQAAIPWGRGWCAKS